MQNLTLFFLRIERVDFSEVTGGFRLGKPPARRERCCLFCNVSVGETVGPDLSGQRGGGKVNLADSPMDRLLKRPTREP
ncbi:MAG: hypothetical protein ACQEQO_02780 [Thermodesulfobacteriota bacterium]